MIHPESRPWDGRNPARDPRSPDQSGLGGAPACPSYPGTRSATGRAWDSLRPRRRATSAMRPGSTPASGRPRRCREAHTRGPSAPPVGARAGAGRAELAGRTGLSARSPRHAARHPRQRARRPGRVARRVAQGIARHGMRVRAEQGRAGGHLPSVAHVGTTGGDFGPRALATGRRQQQHEAATGQGQGVPIHRQISSFVGRRELGWARWAATATRHRANNVGTFHRNEVSGQERKPDAAGRSSPPTRRNHSEIGDAVKRSPPRPGVPAGLTSWRPRSGGRPRPS